jgi:hypothetical protein
MWSRPGRPIQPKPYAKAATNAAQGSIPSAISSTSMQTTAST